MRCDSSCFVGLATTTITAGSAAASRVARGSEFAATGSVAVAAASGDCTFRLVRGAARRWRCARLGSLACSEATSRCPSTRRWSIGAAGEVATVGGTSLERAATAAD